MPSRMKTRNRTPTAGVAIRQRVKRYGKSCLNGSGTSDWNWAISFILIPCARSLVCSRAPACAKGGPYTGSCSGVRASICGPALESWSLLGARLCLPTRWHAPLPGWPVACSKRAASRSRREPARGLCGQHAQLSPLSSARAVSMEWERDRQTAPGKRAPPSAPRRV
jgi:hypothetical protein